MSDQSDRDRALDITQSFIVQAPAGSGKTELLIQRYLALLAQVVVPEQVIAITFTRKAAAEMRRRVLASLFEAASGNVPQEHHRRHTYRLAKSALARSREFEWSIDLQPQRLRIDTLDAMNTWLAHRLSVLSGGVAGAELMESPLSCYRLAVGRTLAELETPTGLAHSLQTLLRGLDNNAARLERMLLELLPKRDQWLPYLAGGSDEDLRDALEQALRRLVEEALAQFALALPPAFVGAVLPILRHVATHATNPATLQGFAAWRDPSTALQPRAEQLDAWRALPELLLTQKHEWRQRFFTADGIGKAHAQMRQRATDLIAAHAENGRLRAALQGIRELPRGFYADTEWALLAALRQVLRHLAAELKVVFGERQSVDFVELALGAQQALGRVDAPSELLLALDQRIQHVLVDEFQDTSHSQLRLLTLLTSGWVPGDGRTLFLVGDPMQSIYRFRQADMSLFLKVKRQGIGEIRCEPLVLESNFRSAPALVEWINRTFAQIFPAEDDMGAGAARFHACRATRQAESDHAVSYFPLRGGGGEAEVECVSRIVGSELRERPDCSIAVLVRSRRHLIGLHERLRGEGVPVHAIELEAPNQQQVIQDLLGLTRALLHLGDRIAWLGILKAPWCGLTWNDLCRLTESAPEQAVWTLMQDPARLDGLSPDGRLRLLHVREVLRHAMEVRALQPVERWIELTWISLNGPACLERIEQGRTVERFFARLGELAINGGLNDPAALEESFAEPYGQGDAPREAGVEIMTIHRAKGLEFDTVILLGLARQPRGESAKGLYWLERVADDGSEDLLLAPLATDAAPAGPVTDFIKRADAARSRAEAMRLLYVATTRARNRLVLVARLNGDAQGPPAGSLLEFLWPQIGSKFTPAQVQESEANTELAAIVPRLRRLREPVAQPRFVSEDDSVEIYERPEFLWASHAAAQVGAVVHAVLHEIAAAEPNGWSQQRVLERRQRIRGELRLLGVDEAQLDASTQRALDALCAVLDDPRGRWLLDRHELGASELPLTIRGATGLEHIRIDRTFVDSQGLRWIVDYKTSLHEGGAVDAFLDSEVERYRDQLCRYAEAMTTLDARPIQLGLYFPLLQAFRSWSYAKADRAS